MSLRGMARQNNLRLVLVGDCHGDSLRKPRNDNQWEKHENTVKRDVKDFKTLNGQLPIQFFRSLSIGYDLRFGS